MWHVVASFSVLIGTFLCLYKKIIQKILNLSDSQTIDPKVATQKVYDKRDIYNKWVTPYDRYYLFYIGLLLILAGLIIEIVLKLA